MAGAAISPLYAKGRTERARRKRHPSFGLIAPGFAVWLALQPGADAFPHLYDAVRCARCFEFWHEGQFSPRPLESQDE